MNTDATNMTEYLSDDEATRAFDLAFIGLLSGLMKTANSRYLSQENTMFFRHGRGMQHPGAPEVFGDKETHKHTALLTTKFEDLVDHRLDLLPETIDNFVLTMQTQFGKMFYSTISAACEHTGNVVEARAEGSFQDAFAAMLEKVEFVARKDGTVREPEIHLGSEAFEKMRTELSSATPEFDARILSIKARKSEEALAHEMARKAKFIRYGEIV